MATVPRACFRCRGSGQVFAWPRSRPPPYIVRAPFWWLFAGVGFARPDCPGCAGRGVAPAEFEPAPSEDPAQWPHRVPPGIARE